MGVLPVTHTFFMESITVNMMESFHLLQLLTINMIKTVKFISFFLVIQSLLGCASLNRPGLINSKIGQVGPPYNATIDTSKIAPLIATAHWEPGFNLNKGYWILFIDNEELRMSWYGDFFWRKGRVGGVYKIQHSKIIEYRKVTNEIFSQLKKSKVIKE